MEQQDQTGRFVKWFISAVGIILMLPPIIVFIYSRALGQFLIFFIVALTSAFCFGMVLGNRMLDKLGMKKIQE
jgi:hypothetical protein